MWIKGNHNLNQRAVEEQFIEKYWSISILPTKTEKQCRRHEC